MPTYEHFQGGQVIERVTTVPDSYEDTRLGLAAVEQAKTGGDGWRLKPEHQPAAQPAAQAPVEKDAGKKAGGSGEG